MSNNKPGLVMVYTGDGKGKTTAAVGQAVRALGQGYRVFMIHLLKGRDYGEYKCLKDLENLTIERSGRDCFVDRDNPDPIDVEMARGGFERAREAALSKKYDLVILDEINVAVKFGLVSVEALLKLIAEKPEGVCLVLTGRWASPAVVQAADMVSEILAIKHHYEEGAACCPGIEY